MKRLEELKKDPELYKKHLEKRRLTYRKRRGNYKYEKTNFPRIFKGTYWGSGKYDDKDQMTDIII